MSGLSETLSRLKELSGTMGIPGVPVASRLSPLAFAPNPGSLDAKSYVPPGLDAGAPLVVVLHGCTQTPEGYDHGTGWSHLADRHGFAVLFPQQRRENNANLCFNWFSPAAIRRDFGEVLSIKSMIDAMVREHRLDAARIFITGLSAGGAMTAAMLATYPEVFAGGTIIAGLPFDVAHSVPEAFEEMRGRGGRTGEVLGALVRDAAPSPVRWPRVSIWQGTADRTVAPANADAVVAQWLDVHAVANRPASAESIGSATCRTWRDAQGRVVVESILISGMGHGVPLDPASNGDEIPGPFLLDAGISASLHSLGFWGIAKAGVAASPARTARASSPSSDIPANGWAHKVPPRKPGLNWGAGSLDVSKVINDALRSAGLLR